MSSTKSMLKSIDFGQLMRAAEGLTQWRVLGLSFLTWLAGGLVMAGGQMLATRMSSIFLALLFLIVSMVVFSTGMSAVGILLQDKAKDVEQRSIMDALKAGLLCVPKFILFGLLVVALMLALCIVAGIVYFICKIPFIGPILLFFAHPAMVIVASVFFVALYWVAAPLLAPAIWDGRSLKGAVSLVVSVVRARLVPLVLMLLALYFVVGVITLVVFSGFVPGFAYMTGLASAIIGPSMLASMGGMGAMGYMGSGHMVAGTLSTVILFAVLMALTMQVMLMGMNIIYLMVTDGLDEKATEESLQAGIAMAREKARQAQEKAQDMAREAADKVRHATHTDGHAPAAPAVGTAAPAGNVPANPAAANPAPVDIFAPAVAPAAPVAAPVSAPVAGAVAAGAAAVTAAVAQAADAVKEAVPPVAPEAKPVVNAPAPTSTPVMPPVSAPVAAPVVASTPTPVATPAPVVEPAVLPAPVVQAPIAPPVAAAPVVPAAPVAAPTAPLPRCSSCFEVVSPDDAFCEHCGHKL